MKLSFLPALSATLAVVCAIPTARNAKELRSLDIRDTKDTIANTCAKDGVRAGADIQQGARVIATTFDTRVHDELKRDIIGPRDNEALFTRTATTRDMGRCVSCVSNAIMRRMTEGGSDWAGVVFHSSLDCFPAECGEEEMVDVVDNIYAVGGLCVEIALALLG